MQTIAIWTRLHWQSGGSIVCVLNWIDVPEGFEYERENKIPVLEEVKDKAIRHNDGKPTHVLIEGENFHALTCLNYTHKGKIDVIYIDPPYNTGNNDFSYNDKRFLDQYPDGVPVPKDSPLRHSCWLSFMNKRLRLAKNLLSDKGVIFISIDDNEQANLKLLCDSIFGEKNFVAKFDWRKKTGANDAKDIAVITESILLYANNHNYTLQNKIWARDICSINQKRYKLSDEYINTRGKYYLDTLDRGGLQYSDSLNFGILAPDGVLIFPNGRGDYYNDGWIWKWSKDKIKWGLDNKFLEFVKSNKSEKSKYTIKYKVYKNVDNEGNLRDASGRAFVNLITEPINQQGNAELSSIFEGKSVFSNPKPIGLIAYLIKILNYKGSIILDFFAGSGTTLHTVMQLNEEDGGHRQCILVQQNEGNNKICENVTYERNRRVMNGYTNSKGTPVSGLGNSLKYYRTAFAGKHQAAEATDDDRISLSQKAGCLLSLSENTLEEIKTASCYQIFSDGKNKFTAIWSQENISSFDDFVQEVSRLSGERSKIIVYIFSWGTGEEFEQLFEDIAGVTIKQIPQPILEIYKSINE